MTGKGATAMTRTTTATASLAAGSLAFLLVRFLRSDKSIPPAPRFLDEEETPLARAARAVV